MKVDVRFASIVSMPDGAPAMLLDGQIYTLSGGAKATEVLNALVGAARSAPTDLDILRAVNQTNAAASNGYNDYSKVRV